MRALLYFTLAAAVVVGCAHAGYVQPQTVRPTMTQRGVKPHTASPIQHIVIIIQENRTFDNLFNGFPGADTVQSGLNHYGQTVPLTPTTLYQSAGLDHSHIGFLKEFDNRKMDGFDKEANSLHSPTFAYQYTQQSDVQPYWDLATRYVVADRMFQGNSGPSFPAHLILIAGQEGYYKNPSPGAPWGCDGSVPMCFTFPTMADTMDAAGVTWRYYSPGANVAKIVSPWMAFDAISQVRYGADWNNGDIAQANQIFTDISAGTLPNVSWIVPNNTNSDHAGPSNGDTGPAWVSSIANALGQSAYWPNTAIFVTWDDWGGWYDHVPPPQLGGDSLGFRVPLVVISPYAIRGTVSHVQHEFGSILHFTEEQFGLSSLGQQDARADDLADCFNFTQTPGPFIKVNPRGHYDRNSVSPPDDDDVVP